MEYMEQAMQQQIDGGISEAERCYDEIAQLKSERDALLEKAKRYDWLSANVKEEVSQQQSEFIPLKTKYVLPYLGAYAEFCGQISFDEAVDIAMSNQHAAAVRQGGAE